MTPKEKLEQIHTNDLEAKGEINALRQYGIGVTGIQRERLGDVVYDLADGYGQGGGNPGEEVIRYASQASFDNSTTVESIVIESDSFNSLTFDTTTIKSIDFKRSKPAGVYVMARLGINGTYALEEVRFNGARVNQFYQAFNVVYGGGTDKAPNFKTCTGLDFRLCGNANYKVGSTFAQCKNLENVTLVPNTLGQLDLKGQSYNWLEFQHSPKLTTASLVSIANGLCALNTSRVVLHATSKTNCNGIMGRVEQRTDDTGTYDFFVQDDSGTMTLTNFITSVKGWTIA